MVRQRSRSPRWTRTASPDTTGKGPRGRFYDKKARTLQNLQTAWARPQEPGRLTELQQELVEHYRDNAELICRADVRDRYPALLNVSTWVWWRILVTLVAVLAGTAATVGSAGFTNLPWSFLVGSIGLCQLIATVCLLVKGHAREAGIVAVVCSAVIGLLSQLDYEGTGFPPRKEIKFKPSGWLYFGGTLVAGLMLHMLPGSVPLRERAIEEARELGSSARRVEDALKLLPFSYNKIYTNEDRDDS